jgi:hypothetical protein
MGRSGCACLARIVPCLPLVRGEDDKACRPRAVSLVELQPQQQQPGNFTRALLPRPQDEAASIVGMRAHNLPRAPGGSRRGLYRQQRLWHLYQPRKWLHAVGCGLLVLHLHPHVHRRAFCWLRWWPLGRPLCRLHLMRAELSLHPWQMQ